MATNVITLNSKAPLPLEVSLYVAADSTGAASVVWRQTLVPPNGPGLVQWTDGTDVALADLAGGVFTPSEILPAPPGSAWRVEEVGGEPALQRSGNAPQADQIAIANESNRKVNAGLGIGGSGAIYKRDLYGGTAAIFTLDGLVYWITVTAGAKPGQPIPDTEMLADPVAIVFPPLLTAALVTIVAAGLRFRLTVTYGGIPATPID